MLRRWESWEWGTSASYFPSPAN